MKGIFKVIAAGLLVQACGGAMDQASETTGATTDDRGWRAYHDTTVDRGDVKVEAVNGGFNPSFFGYRIEARIMTGGNACLAAGVKARLEQVRAGDTIRVVPQITGPRPGQRRCTREFMPQYASVWTEVRADRNKVAHVLVANVGVKGNDLDVEDLMKNGDPVVVTGVTLTPANGGFNPDAFAYDIAGVVQLGSNPCFAAGVTAWFDVEIRDRVIHVTAKRDASAAHGRICTMEYNPVTATITTTVRDFRSRIDRVVIHNADGMGREQVQDL